MIEAYFRWFDEIISWSVNVDNSIDTDILFSYVFIALTGYKIDKFNHPIAAFEFWTRQ